jgi:GntR family transcriptional repressor for pyruvate dehydrogenase complex
VAASFEKVRRVRTFDDVVEQLREAILTGRVRPGERLPGERQLCEELGVGRTTLREALRALEAVGMIEVRPGKSGGSFAITPSESTVGDALASLVALRGASIEDLSEFRVDFEAENAAWAARRADASDIATLQDLVDDAREATAAQLIASVDVRWHEALARATKNRLRIGIALGIHDAVSRRNDMIVRPAALERARSIPDDLAAITAAVALGDAEQARSLMREHIEAWNRSTHG